MMNSSGLDLSEHLHQFLFLEREPRYEGLLKKPSLFDDQQASQKQLYYSPIGSIPLSLNTRQEQQPTSGGFTIPNFFGITALLRGATQQEAVRVGKKNVNGAPLAASNQEEKKVQPPLPVQVQYNINLNLNINVNNANYELEASPPNKQEDINQSPEQQKGEGYPNVFNRSGTKNQNQTLQAGLKICKFLNKPNNAIYQEMLPSAGTEGSPSNQYRQFSSAKHLRKAQQDQDFGDAAQMAEEEQKEYGDESNDQYVVNYGKQREQLKSSAVRRGRKSHQVATLQQKHSILGAPKNPQQHATHNSVSATIDQIIQSASQHITRTLNGAQVHTRLFVGEPNLDSARSNEQAPEEQKKVFQTFQAPPAEDRDDSPVEDECQNTSQKLLPEKKSLINNNPQRLSRTGSQSSVGPQP